jgi:pyruvate formate lyase activating enzyme
MSKQLLSEHARPVLTPIAHRLPVLHQDADEFAQSLSARAVPAKLFSRTEQGHLRCVACAHECVIQDGRAGACGVRYARGDTLFAPANYVARQYVRSVESNTIYHAHPGARALIFGMFGCDLRCPYCHNASISQALRDPTEPSAPIDVTATELVDLAQAQGCTFVCAAYNEPMIAVEWVYEVFREAKSRGLMTAVVTDGNSTASAMQYLRPVCDVFRVDLKAATNEQYKQLGGRLDPVIASIKRAVELGYWVELVTLLVEGFNDALPELRALMAQVATISLDIPWHFNAFVPRYKLKEYRRTSMLTVASVVGMAYARGFRWVYGSNAPGGHTELSHTRCPRCQCTLIERVDYVCRAYRLSPQGCCSECGEPIAGLWNHTASAAEPLAASDAELP